MAPLTLSAVFTSWTADPLAIVAVLVLGVSYGAAARKTPGWSRGRMTAFYGLGLGALLLVSVTFVGVYAQTLFWVRALQIIVLFMITPFGIALGAPVTLARGTLGALGRRRLDRIIASRAVRVLTHPGCGAVLMLGTPWALLLTDWFEASLRSSLVDIITRIALPAIGFVYFYGRLQIDPVPRQYSHVATVIISVAEEIFDAVLGLMLWLGPHLVASGYYAGLHLAWASDLRSSQIIGAGIIWVGGDVAALPFLAAMLRRMTTRDVAHTAEVDRELDEAEESLALPRANADDPVLLRPWWENDPELSQRWR